MSAGIYLRSLPMIPLPADDVSEVGHEEVVRKSLDAPWRQVRVLPADRALHRPREHQIPTRRKIVPDYVRRP